jgi:hypothetical protein
MRLPPWFNTTHAMHRRRLTQLDTLPLTLSWQQTLSFTTTRELVLLLIVGIACLLPSSSALAEPTVKTDTPNKNEVSTSSAPEMTRLPCQREYAYAQALELLPAWQHWLVSPYGWVVRYRLNRCMATSSFVLANRLRAYPVPYETPWLTPTN